MFKKLFRVPKIIISIVGYIVSFIVIVAIGDVNFISITAIVVNLFFTVTFGIGFLIWLNKGIKNKFETINLRMAQKRKDFILGKHKNVQMVGDKNEY